MSWCTGGVGLQVLLFIDNRYLRSIHLFQQISYFKIFLVYNTLYMYSLNSFDMCITVVKLLTSKQHACLVAYTRDIYIYSCPADRYPIVQFVLIRMFILNEMQFQCR